MYLSNSHGMRTVRVSLVVLLSAVLFPACSTVSTLDLISSPSNLVLVSIHPYSKAPGAYTVGSDVPRPYVSRYLLGQENKIPVSSSFSRCTDVYMETKFGRIVPADSAGFTYLIKFRLDSFSFSDSAIWTNPVLRASMRTTVTVMKGDSIIGSKVIEADARRTGHAWEDWVNAALTNEAMNRTFIMIEKYLYSIGFGIPDRT